VLITPYYASHFLLYLDDTLQECSPRKLGQVPAQLPIACIQVALTITNLAVGLVRDHLHSSFLLLREMTYFLAVVVN